LVLKKRIKNSRICK